MAFFNDTQVIQKIKTTPMAPAGCHTHRHASRESYYKEHDLIHHNSSFITTSGHITSHDQSLQKQVRRPLIVVASFTWLQLGSSKNVFLPTNHHNVIFVNFYLPFIRALFIDSAPTKVGETDTRQPPYATSACQSVEPVSRKRTCKVGPGRFIPQFRWARKD